MSNGNDPPGLDFLDFLFTVAVSIGLTPEVLQTPGVSGFLTLSQEWYAANRGPTLNEWFYIGTYALGFLNLTLSWFGYHASIQTRPLKYQSGYGMIRFILDVVLVVMYGIMLVEFKHFNTVIVIFLIVYTVFVIWDILKTREYREEFAAKEGNRLARYRREFVSLVAFVMALFTAIAHIAWAWNRWVILVIALFVTVFYRVNKIYPLWPKKVSSEPIDTTNDATRQVVDKAIESGADPNSTADTKREEKGER